MCLSQDITGRTVTAVDVAVEKVRNPTRLAALHVIAQCAFRNKLPVSAEIPLLLVPSMSW